MSGPILLFGAGGQLGRTLAALAAERGVALVPLRRQEVDITNREAVAAAMARYSALVAVNAAAFAAVDAAEAAPALAGALNAVGPGILAEASDRRGLPLIHLSTDYVFDGTAGRPYREDDPVAPLSVYARSKADGEARVRAGNPRHLVLRTAWLHGPFAPGFVGMVLRQAEATGRVAAATDQRGSPTASRDLAAAILTVAAAIRSGAEPWGTYHFAGPEPASRWQWAAAILAARQELTGRRAELVPGRAADFPSPARRPADSVLDSSRFAATFGFGARPLQPAMRETVKLLLAAPGRVRRA